MRKFLVLYFFFFLSAPAFAVDTKVIDETAITAVAGEDVIYCVDDPSVTPLDRKCTFTQVQTFVLTGNAATATALAANGANCSAGNYPLGVDASGAVESCTEATPADSVGTVALNDGADTPLATEYVRVATGALEFEYRTTAQVLADITAQGTLVNEAGLYTALSDVTNFLQTGDALAGADITDGTVDTAELATDSVNLTKLDDGSDTPVVGEVLFVASGATAVEYKFISESFCLAISDETTAITTGTAKLTMRMPYAFTLTDVRASINTVSSSGLPTFDINESGITILSTKLTIDASEKTSTTATTAVVISDTALADDAEMTFDIDTAGTGTKGAKICLIGHQ